MTAAIVLGALVGLGCLGLVHGLVPRVPSLETVATALSRPVEPDWGTPPRGNLRARVGHGAVTWVGPEHLSTHPRWTELRTNLAVTGESWDGLAAKMIVAGGAGLLAPVALWVVADITGARVSLAVASALVLLAVPVGAFLPVANLARSARHRRRHVRVVIGTFVDLVVLGLAGGVGIEGALFAASQVSSDWAIRRMARVLSKARDSGQSPWLALGLLGAELGVEELVELASTLQLAGTEGARIRQSLTARSVALRRHEQADAESQANSTTERLFLPGALLLIGFLLFVGYPAFSRILGGL